MDRFRKAGLVAVLLVLGGCAEPPAFEEAVRPVRYTEAGTAEAGARRRFAGVAEARQEMRLSLKAAGTIIELPVRMGMRIQAGDLVARLDPADYQLRVETAEASLAAARAQARNAEAEYSRVQQLYVNRNASQSDLDAALAARDATRAQVSAQDRQVALAKSTLDYTVLRAPVDGVVTGVPVEANENVQAGQTAAVLSSGSGVNVSVDVPENTISRLAEGNTVSITFDAIRRDTPFSGAITELGAVAGRGATYPVTIALKDAGPDVLPGMAAQVTFDLPPEAGSGQVVLPLSAVGEGHGGGRFVFVLESAEDGFGTVHLRPVVPGALLGDQIAMEDGVAAGERVVTAGVGLLQDGQRVLIPD